MDTQKTYNAQVKLVEKINRNGVKAIDNAEAKITKEMKLQRDRVKDMCSKLKSTLKTELPQFSYMSVVERIGFGKFDHKSSRGSTIRDLQDQLATDAKELTRLLQKMQNELDDEKKFSQTYNNFSRYVKLATANIAQCDTFRGSISDFHDDVTKELMKMRDLQDEYKRVMA